MKVSIVTINYNNVEGLKRTLISVAEQTYRDIEHIIIDGGSTDGSVEAIKEYVNANPSGDPFFKHTIKWVSEKDNGIYNAMNKGLRKATGDYVWILNSGDCAAGPDVVEKMMTILNDGMSRASALNEPQTLNDGKIDILLGNIVRVNGKKKEYAPMPGIKRKAEGVKCKVYGVKPSPMDVSMLTFYTGTVPQDAAFVRRDLFEQYGYFDDTMKICADWKLYLNMIALGGVQPWYVNIDVVLFDMTGISNANNELRLAERKAYLEEVLPESVRKDYEAYAFPIRQHERLKKHHLWGLVYFMERALFKLEKWNILK